MKNKNIPLFKPYIPNLDSIEEILKSGNLAFGEHTIKFENRLKNYFNTELILSASSFHLSISITCRALGLKIGDEVIMSPVGCLASVQPFLSYGLKIVWADIDSKLGTLDPNSVKSKITSKTKAIVHNHFCGYSGHIDEINQIARENNILVIDDGIECFGTTYKGKKIGNLGTDVTVFSFNAVRIPNTIDGGCIIFKDKVLYEKALLIRDCGIDRSIFRDIDGEINPKCDISLIGYSGTMSNVNGYIGFMQMEFIEEIINKQRNNAKVLKSLLKNYDIEFVNNEFSEPNYWVFGILAKDKKTFMNQMKKIGLTASSVHFSNNKYSVFGKSEKLEGVEKFMNSFVALPSGWWVDDSYVTNFK